MATQINTNWDLIEASPFLTDYLRRIEKISDEEKMVSEMIGFYRELDFLVGEVIHDLGTSLVEAEKSFRHSSLVISHSGGKK